MDKNLEHAYQLYWELTSHLSKNQYDPTVLAGVMLAQAMTIYKTVLSDSDFDKLVDGIVEKKDKVKRIEQPVMQ